MTYNGWDAIKPNENQTIYQFTEHIIPFGLIYRKTPTNQPTNQPTN